MKKYLIIILTILVYSCNKPPNEEDISFKDIKYYTEHSKKSGYFIKNDLIDRRIVLLLYPEYAKESYTAIKYISGLISLSWDVQVIYPSLPLKSNDFISSIRKESPHLGFEEFIDLYDYFINRDIPFLNDISGSTSKLLILAPEGEYIKTRENILKKYKESEILTVAIPGTKYTYLNEQIIRKLPVSMKISSIRMEEGEFDIIFSVGDTLNYRPVKTIELYNSENYLDAPIDFIEKNNSIIESVKIKKMNRSLNRVISNSFFMRQIEENITK